MPSNQKAIAKSKEKGQLSYEDIVAPDILDLSNTRRKAINKISGFNGKTYTKTIKYYIHDKTGKVSLKFLNDLTNYAFEISDDAEQFIVDTFNKVDEAIDLDFQRVNSSAKANIVIYKTTPFKNSNFKGMAESAWWEKPYDYFVEIAWHGEGTPDDRLKDYPNLSYAKAAIILHEIGHALGLSHGLEFGNIDPNDNKFNIRDTLMSYNSHGYYENIFFSDIDISALKRLWGNELGTGSALTNSAVMNSIPKKVNLDNENKYLVKLRDIYEQEGEAYKTIFYANEILKINPKSADAYWYRAYAKVMIGKYDQGIADYTKAIEFGDNYSMTFNNRGYAKEMLEDYYGAKSDYDFAIKMNSNNSLAYLNRGYAQENLENIQEACSDWRKAYSLGKKDAYVELRRKCQ